MGEAREMGLAISRRDIQDAALVFAAAHHTFTARAFTEFLQIQAHRMEEESLNELLCEMAAGGDLREIGPGVYAAALGQSSKPAQLEHPIWSEEART